MYLVTGATGNVGSQVVNQLLARGHKVRVFTRDAGKVAHWGNRVEVAPGDFTQTDTFARAVTAADGVFMMNGTLDSALFQQLVKIAKTQACGRIIFLSSMSAADSQSPIGQLHREKEEAIRESGVPFALVRAGGFMTNTYQWIGSIQSEGVVYNALGTGRFAPVAPEDIAAVAVHALTAPVLTETVFEVTGGSLVTLPEQVGILSRVLGKPLRSVDISTEAAIENFVRAGLPAPVAAAVARSLEAIRDGHFAVVRDTVERVTGRPPRTFEQWAQQHAARFA